MSVSYIIPSLIGLDKTLETLDTNYNHFNRALRTGLSSHFQDLVHQNEMIVATVLDPRIKLQVPECFRSMAVAQPVFLYTKLSFILVNLSVIWKQLHSSTLSHLCVSLAIFRRQAGGADRVLDASRKVRGPLDC